MPASKYGNYHDAVYYAGTGEMPPPPFEPDPEDTTDYADPTVPDLHPDQCARSGHTPARITQDRDGHSRLYQCPCGEWEQLVLATGQAFPKYRTPTMEDV